MATKKKSSGINFSSPAILLALVFIVAFIGGVSGWRVGQLEIGDSVSDTLFVSNDDAETADVVEEVSQSVVSIDVGTVQTVDSFFFGPQDFEVSGAGSGFIVSEDGLVVTNKHVVDEDTTSIIIIDSEGNEYDDVDLVGTDPFNDVAFLQINGVSGLKTAKLGDSDKMRPGDIVLAIGNALGIYENTVTKGIISGVSRPITNIQGNNAQIDPLFNLFQTDASINPGNSGGPLINLSGEVIGINTAVAGSAENIGFAIPISDVQNLISSILETGELQRPYVGIRYVALDEELAGNLGLEVNEGILIDGNVGQIIILENSPAEKAGLERGDVIIAVNDEDVTARSPFTSLINDYSVGDTVTFTVLRDGQQISIDVTLEAAPDNI